MDESEIEQIESEIKQFEKIDDDDTYMLSIDVSRTNNSLIKFLNNFVKLGNREILILIDRYFKKIPFAEIAHKNLVTKERCVSIYRRTVKKINSFIMLYISKNYLELSSLTDKLVEKNTELFRLKGKIEELYLEVYPSKKEDKSEYYGLGIEELNLSTKAYNCLYRAGYKTVGDVAKTTIVELSHIRNLGKVTMEEIVYSFNDFGIVIPNGTGKPSFNFRKRIF